MARQLASTDELNATIPATGTGALTLAAWIYSDTASTAAYPDSVDRWLTLGGIGGNESFVLRREWNGSTHGDLYVAATAGGRVQGGTVTAGDWEHWCGTEDGTTIRLYQNGSQVGSTGQTQAISSETVLSLGRDDTEGFDGRFAEVAIWSRALSADEVNALAKGYRPWFFMNGLIECFPLVGGNLNGIKGAVLVDSVASVAGDHVNVISPLRAGGIVVPAAAVGKATKNIHTIRLGTNLGIRKGQAA